MNKYICDDCQKPFKAFTVELERTPDEYKPCGLSWQIWYYEEGVDVYEERHDHEPNGGHSYFCYKCRPEHKF